MCLVTKQTAPIRARKRIEVYKLIYKYNSEELVTLIRLHPIKLHSVFRATNGIEIEKLGRFKGICGGYIHCFTNLDIAKRGKSLCGNKDLIKIVRCYIEPGTLYWKSLDHREICAKEVYADDII